MDFTLINTCLWALISLIVITAYFLLRRDPRIKLHLDRFPQPPYIPVFGVVLQLLRRQHHEYLDLIRIWVEKCGGPCITVWVANFIPYLAIVDPTVAEKILTSNVHLDKGKYDYGLLDPWLGTGLLTAPGEKWGKRRKLLTPSFHFKILEDFIPIFNEQANIFVKCLEKETGTNEYFNLEPYITKCTLDIICETAMGKKMETQRSSRNKEYLESVNEYLRLLTEKHLRPWLRIPFIYNLSPVSIKERRYLKILHGLTDDVIRARKLEREQQALKCNDDGDDDENLEKRLDSRLNGRKHKAFLDLLLDACEKEQSLTDQDIREEVNTFMFEGHDTTAVNLGWTILMLAMHPENQTLVQIELDQIFGSNPTRDLTSADISRMKYLESCIKETLRLYPSVPFIMRQINSDTTLDDGRIIPRGITVVIALYFIHRHPDYFHEPLSFKPERFLNEPDSKLKLNPEDSNKVFEKSPKQSSYSYIPFSAGPRNCIGQKFALLEEKIVLAKLLLSYRIEAEIGDMGKVVGVPDIVLRNKDRFRVKLYKR